MTLATNHDRAKGDRPWADSTQTCIGQAPAFTQAARAKPTALQAMAVAAEPPGIPAAVDVAASRASPMASVPVSRHSSRMAISSPASPKRRIM